MLCKFKALRVDKIVLVNDLIGLYVVHILHMSFVGCERVEVVTRAKISLDYVSIHYESGCLSILQRRLLPPGFTITFLYIGKLSYTQVHVHLRQLLLKRHNC